MLSTQPQALQFCGNPVSIQQLELIQQTTQSYPKLSRTELAATLCEFLDWKRPSGKLKTVECRQFLEQLEQQKLLQLPRQRPRHAKRMAVQIAKPATLTAIETCLPELGSVTLKRVLDKSMRDQWRSLVEHHHYLGHQIPFGAHLRYLIESERGILGCLQFSSPAWRLGVRDAWIGWSDTQRKHRLQHILCNSRFLILPSVRIPNLASHVLAKAARQVIGDWTAQYGVTPYLLETLVDPSRYRGTCYRAANWIEAGSSSGRGRDDRHHQRHDAAPKQVWLYPLQRDARDRLQQGDSGVQT